MLELEVNSFCHLYCQSCKSCI